MLLEVQCEVSTVSDDLGCHVICWCWSTVFSEVHSQRSHLPGNFRALHASFCWQALWRCWFLVPGGLGTCPHCQRYQKLVQWPWCYCAWLASKLTWPEPHRESMGYCQEEDERHQTQQCRWAEGHCQRNLGFHTGPALRGAPSLGLSRPLTQDECENRFYLWNIMVYLKNTVAKWIGFLALICYYSKNLGQSVSQSRILIVTSDTQTSRASGSTKCRHYAALLTKLKVWWNNFLMFNRGLDYRS